MSAPNTDVDTPPVSAGRQPSGADDASPRTGRLLDYRDDGPAASAMGRFARRQLPPLAPLIGAAFVCLILLITGAETRNGPEVLAPALVLLLLAGPSSTHPHTGRLDWLAPGILRVVEYAYLAASGFAHGVPKPLVYALLAVLAYHHYDTVNRARLHMRPAAWVFRAGLGWDGRMLIAGIGALTHTATPLYATLTVYLALIFAAESIYAWRRTGRQASTPVDLDDDGE
jgi:hypothetical protein